MPGRCAMTIVTVVRDEPPPIVGVIGRLMDAAFEAFERTLDWLETTGILVERIDPQREPGEAARFESVARSLAREGRRCLPLVLVDGEIVSSGVRPGRARLARLVGQGRLHPEPLSVR